MEYTATFLIIKMVEVPLGAKNFEDAVKEAEKVKPHEADGSSTVADREMQLYSIYNDNWMEKGE